MSNTKFRKGLVVAALAGLVTTAIAGTPAFAADGVTLKANTGTALAVPVDQTLTLNASLAASLPAANIAQLKYKVVTDGTFTVKTVATGASAPATAYNTTAGNASFVGVSAYTAANVKTSYVTAPGSSDATHANTLAVSIDATPNSTTPTTGDAPSATTATKTVTVTAWIDSNLDGVVDASEVQQSQTLSFVKYSELTTTAAITAPLENDTAATATYSFTNVNNEQLSAGLVGGTFTKGDGTSIVAADASSIGTVLLSGTTVTIPATNTYKVGQVVTVAGYGAAGGSPAGINGNFAITAATGSSFSYVSATANLGTGAQTAPTVVSAGTVGGNVANIAWDSTNGYFKYSVSTSALVKAQAVKFAPTFNGTAVGTSVTSLITAVTAGSTTAAAAVQSTTETANTDSSGNGSASVATNKAFSAVLTVKDTATTPAVLAGKPVTIAVAVTSAAFPATAAAVTSTSATVTINGVTYTNAAALPGATGVAKLAATSDANGQVTVTGTSTGLSANDTVVITFGADNLSKTVTLTEADAAASRAYINFDASADDTHGNGLTSSVQVAAGSTVAVQVTVNDQFGAALANGKYVAFATYSSSASRTTINASSYSAVVAPVVGGSATLSLPDFGTGTGSNTWSLVLRAVAADGTYGSHTFPVVIYTSAASKGFNYGTNAATTFTVNLAAAADLVPGVVTLDTSSSYATALSQDTTSKKYLLGSTAAGYNDATHKGDLLTKGAANWDGRTATTSEPTLTKVANVNGTQTPHIYGSVKSTSTATYAGVAVNYAPVTVSAKGALFVVSQNGYNVYGVDTLTFNANASGNFDVTVYSTKSGTQTVTVTSGTGSAVVDIAYVAAAATAGSAITLTAPAAALPGTSVAVSAAIADAFGNAVATTGVSATSTNTAYFSLKVTDLQGNVTTIYDGDAATQTGSVSKTLTFGSNDSGVVTLVATYDADGSTGATAAVTTTATIKVALPAAAKNTVAVAASQAQVGAAVDVTATAVDAAGKPAAGVVVSFTVAGQGYLSTASATTNASGVATVKLVSNVAGMNTVSATANGAAAAATAAVTFGNSDANLTFNSNKRRATATYEFAGNAKVVISVNGVRVKTLYPADDMVGSYSVSLKKGKNKVSVSVAGVTTDSRTVTTK